MDTNNDSTEKIRFSTSVSTQCGKVMWRKSRGLQKQSFPCRISLVETNGGNCGISFPQPVETAFPVPRTFHGFLHKFSLSTPQSFPIPTHYIRSPLSHNLRTPALWKKSMGFAAQNADFHFSGPLILLRYFYFYVFFVLQLRCIPIRTPLFCFSEQQPLTGGIHKTMPACFLRKDTCCLSARNIQKIKIRRNCAFFPVHPGQTLHFGSRSQSKKEDDS